MDINVETINPEQHVKVLDALLEDSDLMAALNASPTFEAGYELVAQRIEGLTLEEFTASMELLRQIVMSQMENTEAQ